MLAGIVCLAVFLFPGFKSEGGGTVSIRGAKPYERTIRITVGAFKPWGSLDVSDKYDGKHHNSKFKAGVKTSYIFVFGPIGVVLFIAGVALRFRRSAG